MKDPLKMDNEEFVLFSNSREFNTLSQKEKFDLVWKRLSSDDKQNLIQLVRDYPNEVLLKTPELHMIIFEHFNEAKLVSLNM